MKTCVMCGKQIEGVSQKKYCSDCYKKKNKENHKHHWLLMKEALQKRRLKKFGSFENFCRWAKNQLAGIDLKPYMPKDEVEK